MGFLEKSALIIVYSLVPLNEITVSAVTEGTPIAGQQYNISCIVLFPVGITNPIVIQWYDSEGPLSNGSGISVGDTQTSQNNSTRKLEFNPFRTVHGGRFTCRATVMSQAPPFNISKNADVDIIVGGESPSHLYN